jgi:predicted transposase YbfD/YdcC
LIDALPDGTGCVITLDALHADRQTLEKIVVGKQSDFIVQVKGNASLLRDALEHRLACKDDIRTAQTVDKGHGRIETRRLEMAPTSPVETGWPHVFTGCRVTRTRETVRNGKVTETSTETAFYAASFAATSRTPEQVLTCVRNHWHIENGLHHRKDRSMDEDRNRAARNGVGRIMCCIRSLAALVLGRATESFSVVQRRLSCKPHLLLRLLFSNSLTHWESTAKAYKLA